ncbi:pre-mRNA-splicing factor CWC25 homolog [Chenopodium quinoa]|uniref:pre-mRNA-splicing factor CWC25 homolog n=1 Tax=Chenopodium quinoa TaxID=63459 RepID=UPI000B76CE56|nr:pre-mRNA-splicing factor CWC25 homolog [Chenopodium quinoa]
MALKFLNKKGWHTGSLRNIENVWKAEQKHEQEQRKLEELRKQILEERERDEFRVLQEQAGLTPRQERLEFLYDSGLAVGKPTSDGFQGLGSLPGVDNSASAAAAPAPAQSVEAQPTVPGALFEEKPQSANDAWRKLHTDPLLMIRQREQEALARIKNNPVKMAMIRKSVETKKKHGESHDEERQKVKSKHKKHSSSKYHSESESDSHEERERKRKVKHKKKERHSDTESDSNEERERKRKNKKKEHLHSDEDSKDRTRHHSRSHRDYESEKQQRRSPSRSHRDYESEKQQRRSPGKQRSERNRDNEFQRGNERSKHSESHSDHHKDKYVHNAIDYGRSHQESESKHIALPPRQDSYRRRGKAPQLSEEERAARLREMQMDAETHEEQRWKRLKKAADDDAREANQAGSSQGKSFLTSVQKSVYGAEKGGSSTIEESVRRRSHFRQGRASDESNAFRR